MLKMFPTCLSTDRSETTRIPAIAALERPSANQSSGPATHELAVRQRRRSVSRAEFAAMSRAAPVCQHR